MLINWYATIILMLGVLSIESFILKQYRIVKTSSRRRMFMREEKDSLNIPPPPLNSRGEWEDWDVERDLDDELRVIDDEEKEVSINIPIMKRDITEIASIDIRVQEPFQQKIEDWSGWSEEPPYFDEDFVETDEGESSFTNPIYSETKSNISVQSDAISLQSQIQSIDSKFEGRLRAIETSIQTLLSATDPSNKSFSNSNREYPILIKSDFSPSMQIFFLIAFMAFETILIAKL